MLNILCLALFFFTIECAEKKSSPLQSRNPRTLEELQIDITKLQTKLLWAELITIYQKVDLEKQLRKERARFHVAVGTILALNTRSRRITTQLLNRSLALPESTTAEEKENLVIDRSCSICKKVLSIQYPGESLTKTICMSMPCAHSFCVPCHTQWKESDHYQSNCPRCNGPETSSSIFTINCEPLEKFSSSYDLTLK